MKVQFDQNGFKAQMNSSDTSAEALKHGIRTAKKHTALIFGILSLVLMLTLFPYAMLLDISSDIVDLFVSEGFQSAQEFDEAISELGIPFSLGSLLVLGKGKQAAPCLMQTVLQALTVSRCR